MEKTSVLPAVRLPVGFRFDPTDEELVKHYLARKIAGEELPWDGIACCELYGNKAPWEIFNESSAKDEEKIYVFTKLKKASHNLIKRIAGCGSWHLDKVKEEIYDGKKKNVIGFKKTFSFKVKGSRKKLGHHWIMHEYSLAVGNFDYAICRVYNKKQEVAAARNPNAESVILFNMPQTQDQCENNFWLDSEFLLRDDISMVETILWPLPPALEFTDFGKWNPEFEDYFDDDNKRDYSGNDDSGISLVEEHLKNDPIEENNEVMMLEFNKLPSSESKITGEVKSFHG